MFCMATRWCSSQIVSLQLRIRTCAGNNTAPAGDKVRLFTKSIYCSRLHLHEFNQVYRCKKIYSYMALIPAGLIILSCLLLPVNQYINWTIFIYIFISNKWGLATGRGARKLLHFLQSNLSHWTLIATRCAECQWGHTIAGYVCFS